MARADTEPRDTGEIEEVPGQVGQGVLPIYRRQGDLIRFVPILVLFLFILWFGRSQADSRKWLDIGTEAMYLAIAAAGVNILLGRDPFEDVMRHGWIAGQSAFERLGLHPHGLSAEIPEDLNKRVQHN